MRVTPQTTVAEIEQWLEARGASLEVVRTRHGGYTARLYVRDAVGMKPRWAGTGLTLASAIDSAIAAAGRTDPS